LVNRSEAPGVCSYTQYQPHNTGWWWQYFGDEGAREISSSLKSNTSLTVLNLVDNNIGDAGAKEILTTLQKNPYLTALNLEYNICKPTLESLPKREKLVVHQLVKFMNLTQMKSLYTYDLGTKCIN